MIELRWLESDDGSELQAIASWDGSYWRVGRMTNWKSNDWYFSCRKGGELV